VLNGGHQRQHGLEKRIDVTMGLVGCDVYFIRERRSVLLVRGGEREKRTQKRSARLRALDFAILLVQKRK